LSRWPPEFGLPVVGAALVLIVFYFATWKALPMATSRDQKSMPDCVARRRDLSLPDFRVYIRASLGLILLCFAVLRLSAMSEADDSGYSAKLKPDRQGFSCATDRVLGVIDCACFDDDRCGRDDLRAFKTVPLWARRESGSTAPVLDVKLRTCGQERGTSSERGWLSGSRRPIQDDKLEETSRHQPVRRVLPSTFCR